MYATISSPFLNLRWLPRRRSRVPADVGVRPLPILSPCCLTGLWLATGQLCLDASIFGALPALIWGECLHACDATMAVERVFCDCVGASGNTPQHEQGNTRGNALIGLTER